MPISFLMPISRIITNKKLPQSILIQGSVQLGSITTRSMVSLCSLNGECIETNIRAVNIDNDGYTNLTLPTIPEAHRYLHGFVFSPSNTITPCSKFIGRVRFLSQQVGGRSQALILSSAQYPPYEVIANIYGQTYLVRPTLAINDDLQKFVTVEPGSTIDIEIDLSNRHIPLEPGSIFKLQEGAKVVAEGALLSFSNTE